MTVRSSPLSPFRWSPSAGRYIGPDGQFVAAPVVQAGLEQVAAAQASRAQALGRDLQAGRVSLADWQRGMVSLIRVTHTAAAAAARGGWAQMQPADWGRVGQQTRQQYAYLQRFALDIAGGQQPLNGRFLQRCELYPLAAVETFHAQRLVVDRAAGMATEENELGQADHCDDCLGATAQGRVPIGTLSLPGSRACRGHCHCRIQRYPPEAA